MTREDTMILTFHVLPLAREQSTGLSPENIKQIGKSRHDEIRAIIRVSHLNYNRFYSAVSGLPNF